MILQGNVSNRHMLEAVNAKGQWAVGRQPSISSTNAFRESAGPGFGTEHKVLSTGLAVNISFRLLTCIS